MAAERRPVGALLQSPTQPAASTVPATDDSFRWIVNRIPGFVCTLTPTGEIEFANDQVLDYFGRTLDELRGWATSDAVHPDDLPNVIATLQTSIGSGQPSDIELRLRRADGVYRWFLLRRLPHRNSEGQITRWYTLHADIEERRQAEERLRRSEADLLEAQRLTHTGSWKLHVSSGRVGVSPEIHRIFGTNPDDDTFTVAFWFGRIHPEDRPRVQALFERCVARAADYYTDYRIVLPDGTIKYQQSIGYPILNEAGQLVEFAGTAMDVTAQVQSRAELERAFAENKQLKEQLYRENLALRDEVDRVSMFEEIVGTSNALRAVISRVIKVAPTDSTVLITGETGTGKELIARAIHRRSLRAQRAFVSVSCSALAASLISSELFGHERGAFTGAVQRRLGRFELANGGTIFLDEVGELPSDTQVALLRVLQEREFERVGGKESIRVDVRVIAATNRDLASAQAHGAFRADLFYRLNVFPIELPPLRQRKDDIVMLLEYFVERFGRKLGRQFRRIDNRSIDLLRDYDWPGNIRELQNVVERSVIVSSSDVFRVDRAWLSTTSGWSTHPIVLGAGLESDGHERQVIEHALKECRGRVSGSKGAAARLRVPASTLDSKIKKLGIQKHRFKLG
jgi:PAS domain S-box-containing protein